MENFIIGRSSVVKNARYDHDEKQMILTLHNGRDYVFHDVSVEVWEGFKKAESKGRYFVRNIKGKYKPKIVF